MSDLTPFIDSLKDRLPIEQVVGHRVQLNRKGGRYWGLCPFHAEKSPSFTVQAEQGFFKCFGCGKGGDIITFVREIDGLDFMEALKILADEAGMEVPQTMRGDSPSRGRRQKAREALSRARVLYQEALKSDFGEEGRAYLKERGVSGETAQSFCLGWSPAEPGWLGQRLRKEGFEEDVLVEAGLARRLDGRPGVRDNFWDRLMFPVLEPGNRMAGFGGRYLPGSKADEARNSGKYVNSPEGPCFPKRRLLYGLDRLQEGLRKDPERPILVTEGYLDVILLHQAGYPTAVASLGTALTEDHGRRLLRYDRPVLLLLDGDEPGIRAAIRGGAVLVKEGVDVRVATLPDEKDPADMISEGQTEKLSQLITESEDIMNWRLSRWSLSGESQIPAVKEKFAKDLAGLVSLSPSPVLQELWVRRICDSLQISEQNFFSLLPQDSQPVPVQTVENTPSHIQENTSQEALKQNEREIVTAVLLDPSLASAYSQELQNLRFSDSYAERLLNWCLQQRKEGQSGTLDRALVTFNGTDLSEWLDQLRLMQATELEEVLKSSLDALPHNQELAWGAAQSTKSTVSDDDLTRYQRQVPFSPRFDEDPA